MSDTSPADQTQLTHNAPKHPQHVSSAGELLFEFVSGLDRFRCELRDHGRYGVEAQFLLNGELFIARTFAPHLDPQRPPREMAIGWAVEERKVLER